MCASGKGGNVRFEEGVCAGKSKGWKIHRAPLMTICAMKRHLLGPLRESSKECDKNGSRGGS
jgi:hypothetical protein